MPPPTVLLQAVRRARSTKVARRAKCRRFSEDISRYTSEQRLCLSTVALAYEATKNRRLARFREDCERLHSLLRFELRHAAKLFEDLPSWPGRAFCDRGARRRLFGIERSGEQSDPHAESGSRLRWNRRNHHRRRVQAEDAKNHGWRVGKVSE